MRREAVAFAALDQEPRLVVTIRDATGAQRDACADDGGDAFPEYR